MLQKFTTKKTAAIAAASCLALVLSACGSASSSEPKSSDSADAAVVSITDNHQTLDVPVSPKRVVALDNTVFQTLNDWDIELVAVPKNVLGQVWPKYTANDDVLNVGSHSEPNLEAVIEAEADLIIGGHRFAEYYNDLKKIQPVTIETNRRDGEDHVAELKRQVTILGQIFNKTSEAQGLADALDAAIADAKSAYNGSDTVTGLITSGGKIQYAAAGTGRGVGVVFPTLGLKPAIEQQAQDTSHGDEISVEAIAQANPDWLIVLDRDGAIDVEDYTAAKDLIENSEALQNVTAIQKGQIIYLNSTFYLDEGIQAYTNLYAAIGQAFTSAK